MFVEGSSTDLAVKTHVTQKLVYPPNPIPQAVALVVPQGGRRQEERRVRAHGDVIVGVVLVEDGVGGRLGPAIF